MRFVKMTEMLGDATYWLKAEGIPDDFTTVDALNWITDNVGESSARIFLRFGFLDDIKIGYCRCKIKSMNNDILKIYRDSKVNGIELNDGWGQKNYYIILSNTEKKQKR